MSAGFSYSRDLLTLKTIEAHAKLSYGLWPAFMTSFEVASQYMRITHMWRMLRSRTCTPFSCIPFSTILEPLNLVLCHTQNSHMDSRGSWYTCLIDGNRAKRLDLTQCAQQNLLAVLNPSIALSITTLIYGGFKGFEERLWILELHQEQQRVNICIDNDPPPPLALF